MRLEIRSSKLLREISSLHLHTLCLQPFKILYQDLKYLPQSLTHLELFPAEVEESSTRASPRLPPRLSSLYISQFPTTTVLYSGLPETLVKLHIRAPWTKFDCSVLPSSLTDLKLILEMMPLEEEDFQHLPPNLTRLRMCGFPDPAAVNRFREAHPTLDFELNGCHRSYHLSNSSQHSESIQKMHSSPNQERLKSQILDGWLGLPKATKSLFVPLEIERNIDEWSEEYRMLSTDRETLAPIKFRNRLEESGAALFISGPSVNDLNPISLPLSLTYLSLQSVNDGEAGALYETEPILTLEHILALNIAAPNLRHLQLLDKFDASLLKHLKIPLETFSGGVVWNFIDFNLSDSAWSCNLSEFSIFSRSLEKRLPSDEDIKRWLEHMPRRMRVLKFVAPLKSGKPGIPWPETFLLHLPRKLSHFAILVDHMPNPEVLAKLPPRLVFLMLRSLNARDITPHHLVELPASLQVLHIPFSEKMPSQRWMAAFGRCRPELVRLTSDGSSSSRNFGTPLHFASTTTDLMHAARNMENLGELSDLNPKFRPHTHRSPRSLPRPKTHHESHLVGEAGESFSLASPKILASLRIPSPEPCFVSSDMPEDNPLCTVQ